VQILFFFSSSNALFDALFVGDLHPGNVYISSDGSRFILFDVGIVAEYSDDDHCAIVDILSAFIRLEGRVAGRRLIADSNSRLRGTGDRALDEEKYIDKIEALTIKASGKEYLMEHLGTYISYICDAAAAHHVMMNPSFISAALAVKIQEGIALALDPSIDLPTIAIPVIIESERRRDGIIKSASKLFGIDRWLATVLGKGEAEHAA
jgi:predicted unusual protein kinase regulating ubiquinone biosynthesis (AarF/ABC1/UbiB family)